MEIWMILLLLAADLIIGFLFAVPRYDKKLVKLEQKLQKERPGENLEFEFWKVLPWTLLTLVAWWFVFPYEWLTHWRHWTYPYCTREGAPPGWDEEPTIKLQPRAGVIAALRVSGKAAASEVNERVKKLDEAEKVSPKLPKQQITI